MVHEYHHGADRIFKSNQAGVSEGCARRCELVWCSFELDAGFESVDVALWQTSATR